MRDPRSFGYRVEDGVATVTFARPDRLNALTFEVYRELEDLALDLQADEAARVLVLLMGDDHKEFYRAFTEKRPPRFTGH